MAVSPELITSLLLLPEADRLDLAWRLLEDLHDDSGADALENDDRGRLHEALHRSEDDVRQGRTRPARDLLAELAQRRGR